MEIISYFLRSLKAFVLGPFGLILTLKHIAVGQWLKSLFLLDALLPGRDFRRFLTRHFVNAFVNECNLLIYRVKQYILELNIQRI
jgi:hypothetical protein